MSEKPNNTFVPSPFIPHHLLLETQIANAPHASLYLPPRDAEEEDHYEDASSYNSKIYSDFFTREVNEALAPTFFASSSISQPSLVHNIGHEGKEEKLKSFITFQQARSRPVALITSGGTKVPLERNTVRFIDNFSSGNRGAASAEYFLELGYAVIFLGRKGSKKPFTRLFDRQSFLSVFALDPKGCVQVQDKFQETLVNNISSYQLAMSENRFLELEFESVFEYFHFLRFCAVSLAPLKSAALVFSAAAVSDFYIPLRSMSEHKIQSSIRGLSLQLKNVPKMLKPLTRDWCPEAYVLTFKLETDQALLETKSRDALKNYGHELVVGNLLNEYNDRVFLFGKGEKTRPINRASTVQDIEKEMIYEVVKRHKAFMLEKQHATSSSTAPAV